MHTHYTVCVCMYVPNIRDDTFRDVQMRVQYLGPWEAFRLFVSAVCLTASSL